MNEIRKSGIEQIKLFYLLDVFEAKTVNQILLQQSIEKELEFNGKLDKSSKTTRRRRDVSALPQEWIIPLWSEKDPLAPHENYELPWNSAPLDNEFIKNKQINKVIPSESDEEFLQLFFGFLPTNYFPRLIAELDPENALISNPFSEPLSTIKEDGWLKDEVALGKIVLSKKGECLSVEISPLLFALFSLSKECLEGEVWDPLSWEDQKTVEEEGIAEEFKRKILNSSDLASKVEIIKSIILRWSDRLQGLKSKGPFPFFQDVLWIQKTPLSKNFLTSFKSARFLLKNLIDSLNISQVDFGDSLKFQAFFESLKNNNRPSKNKMSDISMDAFSPKELSPSTPLNHHLNFDENRLYFEMMDHLKKKNFFSFYCPLGVDFMPLIREFVFELFYEKLMKISQINNPLSVLCPITPESRAMCVPIDALMEKGLSLILADEPLDFLPQDHLFSELDSVESNLKKWLMDLKNDDILSSEELLEDWYAARQDFLDKKEKNDDILKSFIQSLKWVKDWIESSQREIEIDEEYDKKSLEVSNLKTQHRIQFEILRENHQQSKKDLSALEKDLSRFKSQVSKTKTKLNEPVEIPVWHKMLAGVGLRTQYYNSVDEKRKERLQILKLARIDREQCFQRLEKIKKQVRKTMKEIEDLKVFHIEQQENIELVLATLEREKDELDGKIKKLDRHKRDYPSILEKYWSSIKNSLKNFPLEKMQEIPWELLESDWYAQWSLSRQELFDSSFFLQKLTIKNWKKSFKDLIPFIEAILENPSSVKPSVAEKVWNTLSLFYPVQTVSSQEFIKYFSQQKNASVDSIFVINKNWNNPIVPIVLPVCEKAIEICNAYPINNHPYYQWLKNKTPKAFGFKQEISIDLHVQKESGKPFFEWSNETLYDSQMINQTPEGQLIWKDEIISSSWIIINNQTRERHIEHGLIDELAWLKKTLKEFKKEWPQIVSQEKSRPAKITILTPCEYWKKCCQKIIKEIRLDGEIRVEVTFSSQRKTDWVLFFLGDLKFKDEIKEWNDFHQIWKAGFIYPGYALSLFGNDQTWGDLKGFEKFNALPKFYEKCVISGAFTHIFMNKSKEDFSNDSIDPSFKDELDLEEKAEEFLPDSTIEKFADEEFWEDASQNDELEFHDSNKIKISEQKQLEKENQVEPNKPESTIVSNKEEDMDDLFAELDEKLFSE